MAAEAVEAAAPPLQLARERAEHLRELIKDAHADIDGLHAYAQHLSDAARRVIQSRLVNLRQVLLYFSRVAA